MAVSIQAPLVHVEDANGLPYVGALQYVYEPNTTTLRPIFTDAGLSISAANPQTSNAKGDFPRVFTAEGTYKIRQEQKPIPPLTVGTLIAEWDDIDSGLSGGTVALPISRGGTGATTAAAARANLDVPSNSELADLASDISALSSVIQNIVSAPQGVLSLASNTQVISSDVTGGTGIWYTQSTGNLVPIFDGAQFNPRSFDNLLLTLNSNHVANGIYDSFVILDSGATVHVTGPVWNTVTPGSCARGTGAGTTELEMVNGLLVNKYAMTARNGATTYSVSARQGTFVGSFAVDSAAGQCSQHVAFGQSRAPGPSNAYNVRPKTLLVGDATASWTYGSATVRASRAQSVNKGRAFHCLPVEETQVIFTQSVTLTGQNNTPSAAIGIGLNSTTAASGKLGHTSLGTGALGANTTIGVDLVASYLIPPSLGLNDIQCLESAATTGTITFLGGNDNMIMTIKARG